MFADGYITIKLDKGCPQIELYTCTTFGEIRRKEHRIVIARTSWLLSDLNWTDFRKQFWIPTFKTSTKGTKLLFRGAKQYCGYGNPRSYFKTKDTAVIPFRILLMFCARNIWIISIEHIVSSTAKFVYTVARCTLCSITSKATMFYILKF